MKPNALMRMVALLLVLCLLLDPGTVMGFVGAGLVPARNGGRNHYGWRTFHRGPAQGRPLQSAFVSQALALESTAEISPPHSFKAKVVFIDKIRGNKPKFLTSPPTAERHREELRAILDNPETTGRETYRVLSRVAARSVRNLRGVDPEDIAQEVWLRGLTHAEGFGGNSSPRNYLMTILKNLIVSLWREQQGLLNEQDSEAALQQALANGGTPGDSHRRERLDLLQYAIDSLDITYGGPLTLDLQELTDEEIGALLGLSSKTVKTRLFRARQRVKNFVLMADAEKGFARLGSLLIGALAMLTFLARHGMAVTAGRILESQNAGGPGGLSWMILALSALAVGIGVAVPLTVQLVSPLDFQRMKMAGFDAYDLGRYEEAIRYFQTTDAQDPAYLQILWHLAESHRKLKDLPRAREVIDRALAGIPLEGTPDVKRRKAVVKTLMTSAAIAADEGDRSKAIAWAKQAAGYPGLEELRAPVRSETRSLLASLYDSDQREDEAKALYEEAIRIYPDNMAARTGLMTLLWRHGDRLSALRLADDSTRRALVFTSTARIEFHVWQSAADLCVEAAHLYLEAGRRGPASRWSHEALRLVPGHPKAYSVVHDSAAGWAQLNQSYHSAREFLAAVPRDAQALYYAGLAALEAGKETACRKWASSLIDRSPLPALGWHLQSLLERGIDPQQALADLQEAIGHDYTWAEPHIAAAQIHKENHDWKRMREAAQEALRADPFNSPAEDLLIQATTKLGLWNEAIEVLNRQIARYPQYTWVRLKKAILLLETSSLREACRCAQSAFRLAPTYGTLRADFIRALMAHDYFHEARHQMAMAEGFRSQCYELVVIAQTLRSLSPRPAARSRQPQGAA